MTDETSYKQTTDIGFHWAIISYIGNLIIKFRISSIYYCMSIIRWGEPLYNQPLPSLCPFLPCLLFLVSLCPFQIVIHCHCTCHHLAMTWEITNSSCENMLYPVTLSVRRRVVGRLVGRSVVIIFLKGPEVTLTCPYRNICLHCI